MTVSKANYNRIIGLYHCQKCKVFIRVEDNSLYRHILQVHGEKDDAKKIAETASIEKNRSSPLNYQEQILQGKYLQVSDPDTQSQCVKDALPVINELPIRSAFQCQKCQEIVSGGKSVSLHKKKCWLNNSPLCEFIQIKAQSLFGGKKTRLFQVFEKDDRVDDNNWLGKKIMELDKTGPINEKAEDVRQLDSFVATSRFDHHIESYKLSLAHASSLCVWQGEETMKLNLRNVLYKYVMKSYELSKQNVVIKTHTILDSQLHLLIGLDSIERYIDRTTALLYFLYNLTCLETNDSESKMRLKSVLNEKGVRLINNLLNDSQNGEISDGAIITLHKLFYEIFLSTISEELDAIPLFASCICVHREPFEEGSFRWLSAGEASPIFAALQYIVRCVVVNEVYGIGRVIGFEEGKRPISTAWERVIEAVSKNRDSGATYIQFLMKTCTNIRSTEMSHVRFIICPKHKNCGILDGFELGTDAFGKAIRSVQHTCWQILENELTFGFIQCLDSSFWDEVEGLQDHLTERRNGFWFMSHPGNQDVVNRWSRRFSRYVQSIGFAKEENDFDLLKAKIFLERSEKFIKLVFWLLQVTSGGPARITEMHGLQVRNSPLATRHLYINNGRLFYVLFYHKGREKKEGVGKPIARFPDKKTSRLLFLYLFFVRNLEVVVVRTIGLCPTVVGNELSIDHSYEDIYRLFSCRGVSLSESILRLSFTDTMSFTGCSMTTRQYRQYYTGMVKNIVRPDANSDYNNIPVSVLDLLHLQASHSPSTAHDTYGVSAVDMKKMEASQLELFRYTSFVWHKTLNLDDDCEIDTSINRTTVGDEEKTKEKKTIENHEIPNEVCIKDNFLRDIREKMSNILEKVEVLSRKIDVQSLDQVIVENNDRKTIPKSSCEALTEKHYHMQEKGLLLRKSINSEMILQGVRKALHQRDAEYRGEHQAEAIKLGCTSVEDGLFIMPTGSGKTLIYQVPVLLNNYFLVVVVVPIVSLQVDIMRRCRKIGIQAVSWEERNAAGARLVLVSAENVFHDSYRSFLMEAYSLNKLHSIVVEEAHLFVQWKNFRPKLGWIKDKIRPTEVYVPLFGLTATCPPNLQEEISACIGMCSNNDRHTVIRQSSARHNISYRLRIMDQDEARFELFHDIVAYMRVRSHATEDIRTIVYCLTRNDCEELKSSFDSYRAKRITVFIYHAGMSKIDRNEQYRRWCDDSVSGGSALVMIATAAFGCGIDVPNVSLVYHFGLPRSIIGFVQESGRAGRDGREAVSCVFAFEDNKNCPSLESCQSDDTENELKSKSKCTVEDSIEYCTEKWNDNLQKRGVHVFGNMSPWLTASVEECRRWTIDNFIDGSCNRISCQDRNMVSCDLCSDRYAFENNDKVHKVIGKRGRDSTTDTYSQILEVNANLKSQGEEGPTLFNTFVSGNNGIEMSPQKIPRTAITEPIYQEKERSQVKSELFDQQLSVQRKLFTASPIASQLQTPDRISRDSEPNPSESVTPSNLMKLTLIVQELCVVCSINGRRRIRHSNKRDEQDIRCFKNLCLACGSKNHRVKECFSRDFRKGKGWCYNCSLSTHKNELFHPIGTYGKKECPNRNSIRFLIVGFQDKEIRQNMINRFPAIAFINSERALMAWAREMGEDRSVHFAEILVWLLNDVLIL